MKILITGATGFLGSALVRFWLGEGHQITALVRDTEKAKRLLGPDIFLIEDLNTVDTGDHIDAIVNLAGAPIAGGLWTKRYRTQLLESRLKTTRSLVSLIDRLDHKPAVMISASAAGYYGKQGPEPVNEDTSPQDIFMSALCNAWENAAAGATQHGVRLVIPRISVVLGTDGGAFPALVRPNKFGVGAVIGDGAHYFPWIHKEDLIRFFDFCLQNERAEGPINCVAPGATTQAEFNRAIAKHLKRPFFMRAPAIALKLMLGEMADLFTKGQHMSAEKALGAGFTFKYQHLSGALESLMPQK